MRRRKQTEHSWQERLANADPTLRVHLVGIGGAGLSAIATVLLEQGMKVSGSDRSLSAATLALAQHGARLAEGQRAENLTDLAPADRPDIVLISSAIDASNPERQAAEALGLPVVKRNDFFAHLLARRSVIAVAGTHGKSTTTAMIVKVLREAGVDCGYIIGTVLPGYGSGSAGASRWFVIEADEYDQMFLGLTPAVAVLTNVEWDHPDCYPTPASFRRAFMQFVDQVPRHGLVVSCADDEGACAVHAYSPSRGPNWITYGLSEGVDLRADNVIAQPGAGTCADLAWWNAPAGTLTLAVPGLHNVRNGLAALSVASWCGVPFDIALPALAAFSGTARRFEQKGEVGGILVYDDYAHHPTEIEATLAAARRRHPDRRIWALFQPHTFSRTRTMLYRMGESFENADQVIVTDIYAAREVDDGSVSAAERVAASNHPAMRYIGALSAAATTLLRELQPGDVLLTLGAGDGNSVG
ncbi:MAG: UDP-N-acetylmuramate--L-alanine ligase, partial [Caldilineaceae bacterium]